MDWRIQVIFYRTSSGRERSRIPQVPFRDRAAAADVLDAIREHGLHPPGVRFKQIRGKLWEFYIEAGASHRVFYVVVTGAICAFFPQTPPK